MATNAVNQTVRNNVNPYLQQTINKQKVIQKPNQNLQTINVSSEEKNSTVGNTAVKNTTLNVSQTETNSKDKETNNTNLKNKDTQNNISENRIDIYA